MNNYVITGYGSSDSLGFNIAKSIKNMDCDARIIAIVNPYEKSDNEYADIVIPFDLAMTSEIKSLYSVILDNIVSSVYCLINCAGSNYMSWLDNLEYEKYQSVMNVNLNTPVFLTKYLIPHLNGGIVLNITSSAARKAFRTSLAYNVSKAGLVMATKQIARELSGITVFAISPNQISDTGLTKSNDIDIPLVRGWTKEETEEYRKKISVSGERPSAATTAEFIAFLVTSLDRCKHLSGSELHYGE